MIRFADVEARLAALAARTAAIAPDRSGRLHAYAGGLARVGGLAAPVGTRCRLGEAALGEIIGFMSDEALVMPFAPAAVAPGARVRLIGAPDESPRDLRGRVVGGLGDPRDGAPLPPLLTVPSRPPDVGADLVGGPFETGVPAIDALLPLAEGQRVGIFAGSGVGKSTLVGEIVRNSRADAVVVASIGERRREIAELGVGLADLRTAVIGVAAGEPPNLRVHGVRLALRTADALAAAGRSVLLIIDSLTRVAHAQRELGAALGEPVALRGYPASALALVSALIDRPPPPAGRVTSIYTVLTDADDLDDPVADTARGTLDGHIVLSRRLAEEGLYPAIDLRRSISRVADRIASEPQRAAIRVARVRLVEAEDARDLRRLGIEPDPAVIATGDRIRAFIAQSGPQPRSAAIDELVALAG